MHRPSPVLVQRARSGLAVLGAVALLVGGVNAVTHAADAADALVLGKKNTAEKSTTLKNKGKGPALKLKAKKGPALSVNTEDLVKNLNAEMVGGLTASQLSPVARIYTLPSGPTVDEGYNIQQFRLPPGTYELDLNSLTYTDNSDYAVSCLVADASYFLVSPAPSKLYAGFTSTDESVDTLVSAARVITLAAPTTLAYGCVLNTSDTEPVQVIQPFTVVVQRLGGIAPGSSTALPVTARAARAAAKAVR